MKRKTIFLIIITLTHIILFSPLIIKNSIPKIETPIIEISLIFLFLITIIIDAPIILLVLLIYSLTKMEISKLAAILIIAAIPYWYFMINLLLKTIKIFKKNQKPKPLNSAQS